MTHVGLVWPISTYKLGRPWIKLALYICKMGRAAQTCLIYGLDWVNLTLFKYL